MATNVQKTPLQITLSKFVEDSFNRGQQLRGQAIPASVVSIDETGTIVTVKFEVQSDLFTLPQVQCALATDEFTRAPIAKGAKGYVIPSGFYMGGMTGLGGGTATFDRQANLATLVFHPVGNNTFAKFYDPNKYVVFGPQGVVLRDASGQTIVIVGPVPDGPHNVLQLLDLIPAADDAEAAAKGVPLEGLYHDNGAVRIRIS